LFITSLLLLFQTRLYLIFQPLFFLGSWKPISFTLPFLLHHILVILPSHFSFMEQMLMLNNHFEAHVQSSCAFAVEYCWSCSFPHELCPALLDLWQSGLQHFPPDPHFRCFYLLPMILCRGPCLRSIRWEAFTILFLSSKSTLLVNRFCFVMKAFFLMSLVLLMSW